MVVLREVKVKDYLKGTKALTVRHYLGVACVFMFCAPGIALYYHYQKVKPQISEQLKKKEEAEMEKARQYFELKSILYESSKSSPGSK